MIVQSSFLLVLTAAFGSINAHAQEHTVARSMANDLTYDENNRLKSHLFVYDASDACSKLNFKDIEDHEAFQIVALEGEARDEVFGGQDLADTSCKAACVERGVERSLAGSIMPNKYYDQDEPHLGKWFVSNCKQVEVCYLNYYNEESPLKSWWVTKDAETDERIRKEHHTISYGERNTQCFKSFIGHEFDIDDAEKGTIANLVIGFTTVIAFGESPPSDKRLDSHRFDEEIKRTLHHEWKRHNRVTRTFSPLGFKKGKLPDDVFASMGSFYYNNQYNVVREEWQGRGVFVNWWETDVFFLQVPWDMKVLYQTRLRDLVEEWAGVPIKETVMYGLRQYSEGARLLTHVDVHQTHAVSLIVNVAQGNLTQPWTVEVQDHMDRLHEVTMEPGDIVYYESAKCLHARNRPMMGKGAYYVNLFTHYAPVDDENWWLSPNPEGAPEPILETQGYCQLKPSGAVHCDDPKMGPYVSPSLFKATEAGHLVDWWEQTAPDFAGSPLETKDNVGQEF